MTEPTVLPSPAPEINPETKPFWDATLEGRFLLRHCTRCEGNHFYPRTICPFCGSFDTEWLESTGKGVVYTYAVTRKGLGVFAEAGPYVLAMVELDEGPRFLTNIVECDPETVRIGDRVEVVFQRTEADAALYRFRPLAEA